MSRAELERDRMDLLARIEVPATVRVAPNAALLEQLFARRSAPYGQEVARSLPRDGSVRRARRGASMKLETLIAVLLKLGGREQAVRWRDFVTDPPGVAAAPLPAGDDAESPGPDATPASTSTPQPADTEGVELWRRTGDEWRRCARLPGSRTVQPSWFARHRSLLAMTSIAISSIAFAVIWSSSSRTAAGATDSTRTTDAVRTPLVAVDTRRAQVRGGTWRIVGDELRQERRARRTMVLLFGHPSWSHYDFTADVNIVEGQHGAALCFHAEDPGTRREFNIGGYANEGHDVSTWIRSKFHRRRGDYMEGEVVNGRWYRLEVQVRGDRTRCLLDGEELFDSTDARRNRGRVGLKCWDTRVRFRNIRVSTPDGRAVWTGLPELPN